ncbi:MAG: TonB-dependent receptor [Lysobacteraceae bacterium SCN 69-123]|jgi:iron complex outermembrane receptor protein|uniref:TonB-dependent receptor plug domain-containing protein n=1 Tax=Stenotrophomonas acidaminiphila TaxID=128780 RepID=UPI00086EC1D9|nr:TonB-dependent receptor [Stenotrophomonas acidaminiphila]MBN8802135.1 TonB-dependent receptor [Stenotrophomonas acidaminiphila]MDF9441110.1 TonB-dependent receptor [Stenotrophomonas acidaminiphila]ODU45683.1 MAG: TonB-dependent receptor [Xanthomonadaceae bacterium SCN 69-123]OJY76511.1 MAG: TonB-dependent receptor [Stenotrophomonas sp. 69-14]
MAVAAILFPLACADARADTADSATAVAGEVAAPTTLDAMIVTGTRGSNRTQFDTLAPVDVFSREEIQAIESTDLSDVLAQLVPSFVVQRLPMADGQVFVRPATLRGLSPDQTLVLVNGRRMHRSALLGSRGAQGPDLSQIPTSAIKRIEVLRDGASAQYGSDAIAGVINIILDDSIGSEFTLGVSEYAEGDGSGRRFGARTGVGLGQAGVLSLFLDYDSSDATSRSRQRPDAIAFQNAHPELKVPDPVQRWGQPDLENRRLGFNLKLPFGQTAEAYAHGLYNSGEGVSDFNWRNPDGTASVYKPTAVFPGWDVRSLYPTGFSPKYGSDYDDLQLVAGVRGQFTPDLSWDVSGAYGRNRIEYTLDESINASLGPASPTSFYLGRLSQVEKNLNADFVYGLPLAVLAAPLNIAFGAEFREETYGVDAGDPASYAIGPGAAAGLAGNSNGAPGFGPDNAGRWSQRSHAAYVDVEAPLSTRWNVGAAARYERFSSFGGTLDGKLSTRFEVTPALALRGSVSTGFRAPTPGQLYTTSTVQGLDTVTLQVFTSGRLSPSDPLARQLGASALKPEQSRTTSLGLAWRNDAGLSGSVDLYDIKVTDRFSQSAAFQIPAGIPNPMGYTSVSYFTNDFDTTTRGVDLVGSWVGDAGPGRLNLTLGWNYNRTQVDKGATSVATSQTQRVIFEERLPRQKGTFSADYAIGNWSVLAKLRHYGAWTDSTGNATGDIFQRFGDMQFFDLALAYRFNAGNSLRIGADNLFDRYPDEAVFQASRGLVYSRNAPYDTDGRNVYAEYRVKF